MFRHRHIRLHFCSALLLLIGISTGYPWGLQAQNFPKSVPDILIHAPWLRKDLVAGTRNRKSTVSLSLPATVISKEQIQRSVNLRLCNILHEQSGLILQQVFGAGIQIQGLSKAELCLRLANPTRLNIN